jgi:hypothetical protein
MKLDNIVAAVGSNFKNESDSEDHVVFARHRAAHVVKAFSIRYWVGSSGHCLSVIRATKNKQRASFWKTTISRVSSTETFEGLLT